ncbi:DUF6708 domain-containing protein, partial [Enterobacter asburiae]|uniref:DUF6708 domain-containing protein n=1 Tax=Enterobacter asburiae TaxID=61645 RepID=UPI002FD32E6A
MPLLTIESQPRLNPPVSCWREDMPESHEPQLVPPQLRCMTTRNDIYLEVPRYSTEVSWLMMLPLSALVVGVMFYFIFLFVSIGFYMFSFVSTAVLFSFLLFFLKIYFITPRDQPIRLNRKRQKLYIFNYNRSRLPWLNWPVSIKVYNWADVYGEIIFSGVGGDRGYHLYGAICEPGTYNVVDRFLLAKEWEE